MAGKKKVETGSPLAEVLAIVDKTMGKGEDGKKKGSTDDWVVSLDTSTLRQPVPHWPTGSFIIDYIIGGQPNVFGVSPCPGLPKGKIVNLYGRESSGKTTVALTASASIIRQGGTVIYLDYEHEIVPDYGLALGVPMGDASKFLLMQPNTLEDGLRILMAGAAKNVSLIVIDSVGAAIPKAIFEQSLEELGNTRPGLIASKWSQFLPKFKRVMATTGTSIIAISQLRQKIEAGGGGTRKGFGAGPSETTQGGDVWKFYSCARMKLTRVQSERGKVHNPVTRQVEDMVIGGKIKIHMDKCKVSSSQGNSMEFYLRWGTGIDDIRSVIELALAHGLVKKVKATFSTSLDDGTEVTGVGRKAFQDHLVKAGGYDLLKQKLTQSISDLSKKYMGEQEDEEGAEQEEAPDNDLEAMLTGKKKDEKPSEDGAEE